MISLLMSSVEACSSSERFHIWSMAKEGSRAEVKNVLKEGTIFSVLGFVHRVIQEIWTTWMALDRSGRTQN